MKNRSQRVPARPLTAEDQARRQDQSLPVTDLTPDAAARLRQLGQAIRVARRNMSQTRLGELCGHVPQTTISRWERGLVDLTVEQIWDLETALDLKRGMLVIAGGYADAD